MWERRPDDEDFCLVRVGIGAGPLSTPLVLPEPGQAESRDPVTAEALARMVADRSTVPGLPITVDLLAHPRILVEGAQEAARGLVRAVVCQLAVLHAPDVLEITAVGSACEREWGWLKWLPHHRHSSRAGHEAHRVVIVDGGPDPVDLRQRPGGATVVVIGQARAGDGLCLDVDDRVAFERPDALTSTQAVVCARRLARFATTSTPTRSAADWPDLVGIGDPARIDCERVWRRRTGDRRLRVVIGVGDGGEPVELDIKEAANGGMGPHGLCVGATGSGKSEFLRTLALGLIATHPPDELNLVLVDFKGGATFLG
ncbi:MAG: FtsK/SpoIIIE domain-containing protein, partial [Myxococcota bacterium]